MSKRQRDTESIEFESLRWLGSEPAPMARPWRAWRHTRVCCTSMGVRGDPISSVRRQRDGWMVRHTPLVKGKLRFDSGRWLDDHGAGVNATPAGRLPRLSRITHSEGL